MIKKFQAANFTIFLEQESYLSISAFHNMDNCNVYELIHMKVVSWTSK